MYNSTIVLNHGTDTIFGCSRRCVYCNWKSKKNFARSQPTLVQIAELLELTQDELKKNFVTLSGGGDPLWNFDDNRDYIVNVLKFLETRAFKRRIITREINHALKLVKEFPGLVNFISFSLDAKLLKDWNKLSEDDKMCFRQNGLEMEISIVLPIDWRGPEAEPEHIKYYERMAMRFGCKVSLRENLKNTKKAMVWTENGGLNNTLLRFVPAEVCVDSYYLIEDEGIITGKEVIPDSKAVWSYLNSSDKIAIYGSFLKHTLFPEIFSVYNDIDIIVGEPDLEIVLHDLSELGFDISPQGETKRAFLCTHKNDASFVIDLQILARIEDASYIVFHSHVNSEKIFSCNGQLYKSQECSLDDIRNKVAIVEPLKDYTHFRKGIRVLNERALETKLKLKGWKLVYPGEKQDARSCL